MFVFTWSLQGLLVHEQQQGIQALPFRVDHKYKGKYHFVATVVLFYLLKRP